MIDSEALAVTLLVTEVSERQWRDVLGIVKTQQNDLDHAYLRRWARSLQVLDLLERALAALEDENDSAL